MIRGFTLIELLVVVTIIVVLLALLTPALDKAIYQAQLAVCSAHIDAMGMGVTNYALSHGRRYPYKRPVFTHESWWSVDAMRSVPAPDRSQQQQINPRYDYRLQTRDYIDGDFFADPLATAIPGLVDPEQTHPDATVLGSYGHWEGIRYYTGADTDTGLTGAQTIGGGMMKMGDRLTWVDPTTGVKQRFNMLATDMLRYTAGGGWFSGHPDRGGTANLDDRYGEQGPYNVGGRDQYLWSRWFGNAATKGAPIHDVNYGFQDGSVRRVSAIGPPPYAQPRNGGDYPLTALPPHTEDAFFLTGQAWVIRGQ